MQAQTIDRCQGDEADAVVLSLVMSYDFSPSSTADAVPVVSPHSARAADTITASDFVQYPNRVNVAVSRARYVLVVVSSDSIDQSMKGGCGPTVWGKLLSMRLEGGGGGGAVVRQEGVAQPAQVRSPPSYNEKI